MPGFIHTCIGPMFGKKTGWLIAKVRKHKSKGRVVASFKHGTDTRFHDHEIVSHDGDRIHATGIVNTLELVDLVTPEVDVVAIDEVQFFDPELVGLAKGWAMQGKRVYCAGLDTDHRLRPFKTTLRLVCASERVTKRVSNCHECGGKATYSLRLVASDERIVIGAGDKYRPCCRMCWPGEIAREI